MLSQKSGMDSTGMLVLSRHFMEVEKQIKKF
jgi:hypothetical protein